MHLILDSSEDFNQKKIGSESKKSEAEPPKNCRFSSVTCDDITGRHILGLGWKEKIEEATFKKM